QVGVEPPELRRGEHSLVDERPRRAARDDELGPGLALGDAARDVELALERVAFEVGADEELPDRRLEEERLRSGMTAVHRYVAPPEDGETFRADRVFEDRLELEPPRLLLRQEADGDAVEPGRRQHERNLGAEKRVGELDEDPRAVAGVGIGARSAAVLEVLERLESTDDRLVATRAVEPRDEGDAARVVLERWVVEPLLPHRANLPPLFRLVRRGERRCEPASPVSGART